jgi:hypothetical protein
MTRRLLRRGELIAVPPPEKALEFLAREGSSPSSGRLAIIGPPEKVRAGIETLAQEYGADEVIVVTITYDHQARRRSYELLAEAFGLPRRSPGGRDARAAAARSASEPRHDQAGRTSSGWNGPTDAGRSPAPLTT